MESEIRAGHNSSTFAARLIRYVCTYAHVCYIDNCPDNSETGDDAQPQQTLKVEQLRWPCLRLFAFMHEIKLTRIVSSTIQTTFTHTHNRIGETR